MPDLGIGEFIGSVLLSVGAASTEAAAASLAADIVMGAEVVGGIGAIKGGIEGGPMGALTGGLEGVALGGLTAGTVGALGPEVGSALGAGGTVGGALVGAGTGALTSAITGKDPLMGAAMGGVQGGIQGSGVLNQGGDSGQALPSGNLASTTAPPPGVNINPDVSASGGASFAPAGNVGIDKAISENMSSSALKGSDLFNSATAPSSGGFMGGGTSGGGSSFSADPVKNFLAGSPEVSTPNFIGDASKVAGGVNASASTVEKPSAFMTAVDNPSFSNIGKALGANAGLLSAGAGLAGSMGSQTSGLEKGLKEKADMLGSQGQQLSSYLASGTLPPGLQASVDQATKALQGQIRSQYAARGMSGSSAEMQDLQNATNNASARGAQYAMQLLETGASETKMSAELYHLLIQDSVVNDTEYSTALSQLAQWAASGQKGA
jgi:hypothetical protein